MKKEKKITFAGGRQQGKTEQMREVAKDAIDRGSEIYLPKTPSIAIDEADGGEANKS